ncbi:hypothetical protein EC988_000774 [Linderina pennispora]|nr:hypothetical protein EC988_000774 [Linderina pennispora]
MALAIAVIHTYNELKPTRPIALFWVKYLLPMANLFYLPMLVMLIGSASCLSKLGTSEFASASSGLLRCDDPSISKTLYLSCTIAAYTVAYIILTTFVTSFDRIPIPGEIHFRSQGIAFLKNMSMLLSIDSFLVDNDHRHIRSIISVIITVAMACFNINSHPCFVEQINFWRSYSLCCILWVALLVTMLTNENTIVTRISVGGISAAIAVGAVVLLVLFVVIWHFRQGKLRDEEEKASLKAMSTHAKKTKHNKAVAAAATPELPAGPVLERNGKLLLSLFIKLGAQSSAITSIDSNAVHARIAAPPRDGEANKEVIVFVAKLLKVPKSSIDLVSGHKSRSKVVQLPSSMTATAVLDMLHNSCT